MLLSNHLALLPQEPIHTSTTESPHDEHHVAPALTEAVVTTLLLVIGANTAVAFFFCVSIVVVVVTVVGEAVEVARHGLNLLLQAPEPTVAAAAAVAAQPAPARATLSRLIFARFPTTSSPVFYIVTGAGVG